MITGPKALLLGLLACVLMTSAVRADETIPSELQGIEIEERLGQQVPLDTTFVDHTGAAVTLRSFFAKGRPVILVLNYYGCPTLCSLVLNGLTTGLRGLEFTVGEQFEVVGRETHGGQIQRYNRAKRVFSRRSGTGAAG